ncbi:MAG: prepilin peptidase [Deltaproteobacteria bacterium SG8_13]|nr:MAG: prepilin peptidase [Deltaproteobacteria bacterium SG8_13]
MSALVRHQAFDGIYPEREEPRLGKVERFTATVGGMLAPWLRPRYRRFQRMVDSVNAVADETAQLSDAQLPETARSLGLRLRREGYSLDAVSRTFALVREASQRTVGLRHLDVQIIGGTVLLGGRVAEMETGEGKTLTATLPACVLALAGVPVHIITVNDYLASRDAEWMGPIYRAVGLSVGTIVHGMDPNARRQAYRCNITYCTNKEVAFDYLRDRIVLWDRPTALRMQLEKLFGDSSRVSQLVMRGLHFAIVDEADSVLVDEARTPLIISSEAEGIYPADIYRFALEIARTLSKGRDFTITSERALEITRRGKVQIRQVEWDQPDFAMNEEQREELIRQALVALHLYDRDRHYLVKDEKVQIIDEYTGRLMADRSWERGLHQLIEVKEGCEITQRKDTRARISYQRFFRRYLGLAGMTGTAREVAGELWSIYRLKVVTVPTHRPMQRRYLADRVYTTADKKWDAVVDAIDGQHQKERPVLVGTRSVEASEHLSELLTQAGLEHSVLNARQDQEEAEIVSEAGAKGRITVATNMAGRGTDIKLAEGVAQLGGLFVVATERHDARRIDRQLFGRCGRQGDPGSAIALVCLEDELVTVYIGKVLRSLAYAFVQLRGPFSRVVGRIVFGRAQRSAEALHSRMRRDLLKLDEQISDSLAFSGRLE